MGKAALYTIRLNLYFIGPFFVFSGLKPKCFSAVVQEDLYTLDMVRATVIRRALHISAVMSRNIFLDQRPEHWPGGKCAEPETIKWTNYKKEGLHISADVSSEQDFYAAFPLHYYPGYRILTDGVETEGYTMNSLLTCDLLRGTHHIEIDWVTPVSFRVCDIASLCVVLASLVWYFGRKRRQESNSARRK